MTRPIVVVDAFADRPFAGNPAAVCVLDRAADEAWMKDVAREMNLSETAFLHPLNEDSSLFALRWLTPSVEVDLCGHATLASAHVLWESGRLGPHEVARFSTRSGILAAKKAGERIEMDFPALATTETDPPEGLAEALGSPFVRVASTRMDLLVELKSEQAVRSLRPDLTRLARLPVRGVIVTSLSTSAGQDFVSRFFAPQSGVPEDPVTGSAHCALAVYWGERTGRDEMVGYQASARGGFVGVRREGDRVILGGRAVTTLKGEIAGWRGPA